MDNRFENLILLIRKKISLIDKVDEQNLVQKDYLKNSDFENLSRSIEKRQNMIDDLMHTEQTIKASYNAVMDEIKYEGLSYENEINEMNDLNKKANRLLKHVIENSRTNENSIIEKMNELKSNIKLINTQKKSLTAYSVIGSNVNSFFIDKRS